MSDAEGGQTPAEAGSELRDPDTMSTNEAARDGVQAPAQAIDDFGELYPRQQTRFTCSVLSTAGDDNTVHSVDTRELTCTCEDHTYRRDSGEGDVCKHVAAALYSADRKLSPETDSMWTLTTMLSDAREAKSEIESIRDLYSTLKNAESEAAAEGVSEHAMSSGTGAPSLEETTPEPTVDPQEAADELQRAFNDVVDDMQVTVASGKVWFQTGRDTPDEWPFPGTGSTFEAVTGPDVVEYVYESDDGPNHEWYDEKPGEWWKNALRPGDVEEYIAEVLS